MRTSTPLISLSSVLALVSCQTPRSLFEKEVAESFWREKSHTENQVVGELEIAHLPFLDPAITWTPIDDMKAIARISVHGISTSATMNLTRKRGSFMKLVSAMTAVPFVLASAFFVPTARGDDSANAFNPETVFSGTHSVSGAGGFVFGGSTLDGKLAFMAGGRGAAIINHFFEIGGAGTGMSVRNFQNRSDQHLAFGYGGILIGVVPESEKIIHTRAHFVLGSGGASIISKESDKSSGDEIDTAVYGVFEPSIGVELNLFRYGRAYVDVSWRQVWGGATLQGLKASDFSSWSAALGFRFGSF
jgi:hypothetical protein